MEIDSDFRIETESLAAGKPVASISPITPIVARLSKTDFSQEPDLQEYKRTQKFTVQFDDMENPTEADIAKLSRAPVNEFFELKNGKIRPKYVPIKDRIKPPQGRTDYGWSQEKKIVHLKSAYARGWKQFPFNPKPHDGVVHIVGGGPSLRACLPELRRYARKKKHFILSLNKTHDFLWDLPKFGLGQAIPSWGAVLLDPCDWVKDYITPRPKVQYFIGDQCAPETFDVFESSNINKWIWRATKPGKDDGIPGKSMVFIPGGSTVGLRSRFLMYICGFRNIHYWGFDSSAEITTERPDGKMHGYDKDESVKDRLTVMAKDGRGFEQEFITNSHMARQAQEYMDMRDEWAGEYKNGHVQWIFETFHGDGLLPTLAARVGLHADPKKNVKLDMQELIKDAEKLGEVHAS